MNSIHRFKSLPIYQNVDIFIQLVAPRRTLITLTNLAIKNNGKFLNNDVLQESRGTNNQFLKCNFEQTKTKQ